MRSGIPKEGQATDFKRLNSRGLNTSAKRKNANYYNDAPPPLNAMPNQKLGQIPYR
jgi:hypothetical protein